MNRLAIADDSYFNDANMCDELATCAMVHPICKSLKWIEAMYDARNVWGCFAKVKLDRKVGGGRQVKKVDNSVKYKKHVMGLVESYIVHIHEKTMPTERDGQTEEEG